MMYIPRTRVAKRVAGLNSSSNTIRIAARINQGSKLTKMKYLHFQILSIVDLSYHQDDQQIIATVRQNLLPCLFF